MEERDTIRHGALIWLGQRVESNRFMLIRLKMTGCEMSHTHHPVEGLGTKDMGREDRCPWCWNICWIHLLRGYQSISNSSAYKQSSHTHTSTVQKNIHTQALTSIYCVQANENPYPNPNHAGRSYSLPLLPQLKTMTHSMNNKDTSYFYDV